MYNRYLSGEYIPTNPPQEESLSESCESLDNSSCDETSCVPCKNEPCKSEKGSGFDLSSLLKNIHFDTDDLLLLAILWLLLRDSDDSDVILIVVALFVMGIF